VSAAPAPIAPAAARVSAASALLDRGWGRAPQVHSGEDGGSIQVVIRTASLRAVNWRRKAKAIANEKPVRLLGPSVAPVVLLFGGLAARLVTGPT
jgi:hypothetical protein